VVFSAAQWAKLLAPRKIVGKTLLPDNAVVFEWGSKYKNKSNPGVGPALGIVKDAQVGRSQQLEVLWADASEVEVMARSDCRLTCEIGEAFRKSGKEYTLQSLEEEGVKASVKNVKQTARKSQKSNTQPSAAKDNTDPTPTTPTKKTSRWRERRSPRRSPNIAHAAVLAHAVKRRSPSGRRPAHCRNKKVKTHNDKQAKLPNEDADADEDADEDDRVTLHWDRCRAPKLSADVDKLLQIVFIRLSKESGFQEDPLLFPFIHRVTKEYARMHRKFDSEIFLHRESFAKECIRKVFQQMPSGSRRPYDGSTTDAYKTLFPLLEEVFKMPHPGIKRGSEEWQNMQVRNAAAIPYAVAVQYPRLLSASVKWAMLSEEPQSGRPVLGPEEIVPSITSEYDPEKTKSLRVHMPKSVASHTTFPFFRLHAHLPAIRVVRNLNLYPVFIKAKDMPTGVSWTNIPQCLHTYHHAYCGAEGLTKTHKLARSVLLYLFFGSYMAVTKGKQKPAKVIRGIHKKASEGRHRLFVNPNPN